MNQRAVSAPYFAMMAPGSTVLRLDLDMASTRPIVTASVPPFTDEPAEVRVVWQRAGGLGGFNNQPVCADSQPIANFSDPLQQPLARYNFVYLTSSILRNKAQLQ